MPRGNLLKSTDAEGNETGYEYDNQSRLVKVILVKKTEGTDGTVTVSTDNSMNYTYSEGYDANDKYYSKVTATNAKGAVSEEISDANGKVIKVTDKGTSGDTVISTAYEYDARGNIVKEIHSAGDYITYSYDSLGRVTEKQQYSSAGAQLYRTVYTYYSGLNLVKDMKDYEAGTLYRHTYYEYDSLGRISAKAESNSEMTDAEKSAKAVSYTYNLRGEVTGTGYGSSLTNIAAGEISGTRYEYNSYGQLTGVYVRKGTSEYKVKEYSYTHSGNVMQIKDFYNYTSGTGWYIALSYSYDAYGRVTAMVYEDSNGAVIEKHEYAYNRNGQVVKETNLNNVSVNPVNETRSYAYDYMGNLLKSEITGSANVTTLYTYDKVGNRLTKKQNNVTTTYTYNGLNQLTGESGGGNSLNYVYDANGNQIRITGTADGTSVNKVFAYTPSGNMTSYTNGTVTQVNRYNGDGQRVSKTEGSDVTNYFYQDGSVLYTTDSQGNVKAFNLLNVSDILGTLRINGNNVSSYFYTEDMRGSTVNVIDNSGNTVLSYWYDDFGQVNEYRESGNSLINEVQYTGAIYDELTGLLYLNARFYDPATGRFISQDTYRGERDDAGTWHLYAYCANDPVNYVDPSGHNRLDSWILQALTRKSLPMEIKNAIRLEVSAGASAYLTRKGYVLSRKMFNHAIWGYGRPLSAATYRLMKEKLNASDTLKNSVRKNIDKQGTLSTEFTSGDLYYSLQHVNYKIRSKKKSGKGFLVGIIVYDDYNFDNIRRPLHVFSNAANNLGFMLERLRISYPYSFKTTFIMKV